MKKLFDSFLKRSAACAAAFTAAMIGATASAEAAVVTPVDDSYVSYEATSTNYGSNTELVVKTKRNTNTNASYATQEAVIQFQINPTDKLTDAALYLDVSTFDENLSAGFYIWGIADDASVEDIDESTVTWSTFSNIVSSNATGMDQSSTSLYDGDSSTTTRDALGTLTVTQSDLNRSVKFTSQALIDFINADTDGIITIVISRALRSNSFDTAFASSEHATLNPPRLFVQAEETITATDDTHIRYNSTEVNGGSSTIFVKNAGTTTSNTRQGIVEFDVTTGTKVENASIYLDVAGYNMGSYNLSLPEYTYFWVWGVKDSTTSEDLNESTATYSTYSSLLDSSTDGVINGNVEALGSFRVYSTDLNGTVSFTSTALVDFINADTNGKVTILLTRDNNNSYLNTHFASTEHTTLEGPRLWMQHQLDDVTTPSYKFQYADVDHDGEEDLLVVVSNRGGGGYIIADPFQIAEFVYSTGNNFGYATELYDALSASQQSSLKTTINGLTGTTTTTVSATLLQTTISGLPDGRTYEVTLFSGDASFGVMDMSVSFTALSVSTTEQGLGYASVDVGTVDAAMTVTDEGLALGAEANVVVVTLGVGSEKGSTASLNVGAGAGMFAELKYGKDGQYGFSLPLVVVPVGITIYVEGSDAINVWNHCQVTVVAWGGSLRTWTELGWDEAIDWSNDVYAVASDKVNDGFIYVENSYGISVVWVNEAGIDTKTWLSGTTSTVASEVDYAVGTAQGALISTASNAATSVSSWVSTTATTVTSAYNSVSGWIDGAASTVSSLASTVGSTVEETTEDVVKWVCKYLCW